jgi:hypothetical protein
MPDRIFAGLTARQIAILGGHALVIWSLYGALAGRVPIAFLGAIGMPVALLGAAWAWGKPEGTTFERLAVSAARHLLSPRRKVLAPEGVPQLPAWTGPTAGLAPIDAPVAEPVEDGLLDLAGAGATVACRASSLNFSLRSEQERRALVDGFGRMLNSLDAPVQFVVRSERADLHETVGSLEELAPALPHRALEAAAREHAEFLRSLAARRDVLRRQMNVCFRDPGHTTESDSASHLAHRVEEATTLLRGIGIKLVRLDRSELAGMLACATDPEAAPIARSDRELSDVVEAAP